MKRVLLILLTALLMISFVACGTEAGQQQADSNLHIGNGTDLSQEETEEKKEGSESMTGNTEPISETDGILIVYFSRWGNTDYPDDYDASTSASIVIDNDTFGTTEFVARMIQKSTGGDLHPIQTQEKYPTDFDELQDLNHTEMNEGFLPPLVESSLDISKYETVFIGYPVWATDVPQAVLSFLNEYHLSGKTVVPFCTHDGYGAGGSFSTIKEVSYAETLLDGLAIEAKDVPSSEGMVADWLNSIGIPTKTENTPESGNTAIKITIGDTVLDGVLFDTALAKEIKEYFPLTISMVGYGGREYYGGVDFYPENLEGGQKNFENGDITYCEAHHNMAIFYTQTDNPNLSVDVIPIGWVTSDLSVFDELDGREDITFSL